MKNIIYISILIIFIALSIFSFSKQFSTCQTYGYEELKIESIEEIRCVTKLEDGKTSSSPINTNLGYFIPLVLLLSVLFYREKWDYLTLKAYNNFSNQNIKKEAVFISTGIFLYFFLFLLVPVFFKFQYYLKPINQETFEILVLAIAASLAIAVPLGISTYIGKKWLNSEAPNKMTSKMLLSSLVSSLLVSVVLGVIFIFVDTTNTGSEAGIFMYWLFSFWMYVLAILFLTLIYSNHLYSYKTSQNHEVIKWIVTILALLPYAIGAFGMMS